MQSSLAVTGRRDLAAPDFNVDTFLHMLGLATRLEPPMTVTTLTSRGFNQDASGAKKAGGAARCSSPTGAGRPMFS